MKAADVPIVRTRTFGTIARRQEFQDATLIDLRYQPDSALPLHAHAIPLFLLTLAGTFEETVTRRVRTCRAPQLIYRPAGEPHSQRFGRIGATCLAIELPGDRLSEIECAFDGLPTLAAMRMYDEFQCPTAETPLIVEETVATLTAGSHRRVVREEHSPRWLQRVVDMIESRLSTDVRLRDLAVEANRHPVHVSRCFRRRYGCDVGEFVRRRRVHEACRRIRDTRDSLSAIAVSTGFSDQSHMGRAFRDVMGRSPGAYRQPAPAPRRLTSGSTSRSR
jgi:AraC-like DNA-binding protein